jgi:Kef-type K+ transport system membrane component KefB
VSRPSSQHGPPMPSSQSSRSVFSLFSLVYLLTVVGAVGLFLTIRARGEVLMAPVLESSRFAPHTRPSLANNVLHVLFLLVAVTCLAKLLGLILRRFQQPPVISEMMAGVMLGPSLLGWCFPSASQFLLPKAILPAIEIIAQIGIVLYMFVVGLELDTGLLRGRARSAIAISHASIVFPMVLGSGLALWLYPRMSSADVPFTAFALFVAVSMSVTAFPVLARILSDRGMQKTPLGATALTCAAIDDVSAWCLLAVVVSIIQFRAKQSLMTIGLTTLFVIGMLTLVRRGALLLARVNSSRGKLSQGVFCLVICAVCVSAMTTELIGIHALFGAFLLGVVIPHDSRLARELIAKLEDLVVVLFLPAFFALTGLRTQIGLIGGAQLLVCGLVIAVASLGKFGGTALAARVTRLSWREAASLGVLMNTRGLMELVVLNIGLDLGVLSPRLFTMLVVMALVTTFATTPLLRWMRPELVSPASPDENAEAQGLRVAREGAV